jgi:phospholipid transport system substrate-binding protein
MIVKSLKSFFAICLLGYSLLATALVQPPEQMLQTVTDQLLSNLQQQQNRNEQALLTLVNQILVPHINLDLASQLVLGKYWASATPQQRAEFKTQFTVFMARTYSTALSSYTNEKVRYFPVRGDVTGDRVQVNSAIDQANGQSVSVSYRLALSNGEWKVYDFSVENVSIVENYRSQFADVLRTSGLDGLLQRLKAQNQGQ